MVTVEYKKDFPYALVVDGEKRLIEFDFHYVPHASSWLVTMVIIHEGSKYCEPEYCVAPTDLNYSEMAESLADKLTNEYGL